MRDVVIDANVAAAQMLDLAYSASARHAVSGAQRIIAPDIVVHEFANALWKLVAAGRISERFAHQALDRLNSLFNEFVTGQIVSHDALKIAIELTHPVYDCFYLALARQRDSILITADRRLAARVAGTELAERLHLIEP